jgi:hypothetical protein
MVLVVSLPLFLKLEHFIMLNYIVTLRTYCNNSLYSIYVHVMYYSMLLLIYTIKCELSVLVLSPCDLLAAHLSALHLNH